MSRRFGIGMLWLLVLFLGSVDRVWPDAAFSQQGETVLYQENFEDGQAQGWQLEGAWKVVKEPDGNWALHGREHNWARYTRDAWGDYTFKLRLKLVRGRIHINYRVSGCTRYFIGFDEQGLDLNKTSPCGSHPQLRTLSRFHSLRRWYEIKITGKAGQVDIYVDGFLAITHVDPQPLLYGTIALETLDGSEAYVDDIEVRGQASPALGLRWVKTGGPLGGLGYDVRMHPDNPNLMYVTDAWSGVNISADGSKTWYASNEGIVTRVGPSGDGIPVFSLTIDPRNHDVIWVGTQNRRGIFKSTDGGKTWVEKVNGVIEREGITFRGFTIDPRDSNIVYAAAEISSFVWAGEARLGKEFDLTKGVVYKTTDGGEHWTAIWRGDNLARYIWIHPRNPSILYVSTGIFDREAANSSGANPGGVGVLKSTDSGRTWHVLNQTNGLKNLYIGSLFMHPENPDILIAAAGVNAYRADSGVYLTADGGQTWRKVLATRNSVTSVEFSLADPKIAYAGSELALYRSEDGGYTWKQITPKGRIWGPPGVRAGIAIDFQVDPTNPNRVFVNNYGGGNFLSEDGGGTWTVASQGYTGAQLHDISVASTDSNRVFAIGRSGPFRSLDGGATWEGLNYEPAGYAEWYSMALDPKNSNNVLISTEFGGELLRSTDGGMRWELVFSHPHVDGNDFNNRHGFKTIAFAPPVPSTVYAGISRQQRDLDEGRIGLSFGIYKSTDGGLTWQQANDSNTATQNINDLVINPRDANIVYAATVKGGIFKTTDVGKSWTAINVGLAVLDIRALAIDPKNHQTLYAGAEGGGVYKSMDGGTRWIPISVGMDPQASVRSIVVDPMNPQVVYAADLRTGVYRSEDGGKMWVKINEGLRTRAVKALAISSDGKTLYAATEGEGVFRLDLSK